MSIQRRITDSFLLFALSSVYMASTNADVFNARNSAMGGVGVASSKNDVAALYNPALLTRQEKNDSFSIILPAIGVEASDKDDVVDTLDDLVAIFDELESAIDNSDAGAAADAKNRVLSDLAKVDNKPVRVNAGAAIVVAVPGDEMGFSFDVRGTLDVVVRGDFDENDEAVIDAAIAANDSSALNANLGSSATAIGAYVNEIVLSFAKSVEFAGNQYSFAVAPKYQTVETILYVETANDFDSDEFDADQATKKDSNLNIDFGAALYLNKEITIGATLRNLIGKDYQTVNDPATGQSGVYQIDPSLTAGFSYASGFLTASVDLDLLPIKTFKRFDDSQFLRSGVEFNAADWAQLRLGVRIDLKNTRENVATFGVGLSPFDVFHLGLTAIVGEDETYGGAIELKLTL